MKKLKGRRGKGSSSQPRRKAAAGKKRPPIKLPGRPFRFLPHMADIGFLARGTDLTELFANAAAAMCEYGWELKNVKPAENIDLRVRAATLEDLLFSWLSEILFLTDAEQWVFRSFDVDKVEQPPAAGAEGTRSWEIVGRAHGERFEPGRHRSRTYIKAVTYHQLSVQQTPDGWQATVYLDV